MTDRRLKDLSYGRLGRPVYHAESGWNFAQDHTHEQTIQQLLPLKEHLKPSLAPQHEKRNIAEARLGRISQQYPELQIAEDVATAFASLNTATFNTHEGSLLSNGVGLDVERISGPTSTFPILAMSCGEAGHFLRIIRPRIERRVWEKKSSTSISVMALDGTEEQGLYRVGSGGALLQVLFSEDKFASGSWLAVRQINCVTIFRITYATVCESAVSEYVSVLNDTKLAPVSIAKISLEGDHTSYADVTFNPLYNKQIATIDQSGHWVVWENEPRHGKNRSPKLTAQKSGWILQDFEPDSSLKIPNYSYKDGWCQVVWVSDLTTIVVCNRTHLAVFDIKDEPLRLDSTQFMISKGIDIILDIKRSVRRLDHVFVLTSSYLYWLEISTSSGISSISHPNKEVKILLSYRHFRNGNDEKLRLATLQDDLISVILLSASNSLVNFYNFTTVGDEQSLYSSSQGAFHLRTSKKDDYITQTAQDERQTKSVCWMSAPYRIQSGKVIPNSQGDLGSSYNNLGVRFLQPFVLTNDLGLSSTLLAVHNDNRILSRIRVPNLKHSRKFRPRDNPLAEEPFVVQDSNPQAIVKHQKLARNSLNVGALLNWKQIHHSVFFVAQPKQVTISQLLGSLLRTVEAGFAEESLTPGTLYQLSLFKTLNDNLDQVGKTLDEFFESLPNDHESTSDLVVSTINNIPGLDIFLEGKISTPLILYIYQKLVSHWIANLPLNASVTVRGSKFRIVRQIAVELGLSLNTITLQKKASAVRTISAVRDEEEEIDGVTTRESSPSTFYSAQASMQGRRHPELNFPTPTLTPSIYSQQTSAFGVLEDPTISRLRQYAICIRPRPDTGKSKLLSEWPSIPGVNPSTFAYKQPRTEEEEVDSERESARHRKEIERRRRRTEKFLQPSTEVSRAVTPAGSQPPEAVNIPTSSLPIEIVSMTQPDRGTFGSRKSKGKKKQRTAGF